MDGGLKYVRVIWFPAQICLEQICINPKGVRQEPEVNPCRNDGLPVDLCITTRAGAWELAKFKQVLRPSTLFALRDARKF